MVESQMVDVRNPGLGHDETGLKQVAATPQYPSPYPLNTLLFNCTMKRLFETQKSRGSVDGGCVRISPCNSFDASVIRRPTI
jgi:hypothetical protein